MYKVYADIRWDCSGGGVKGQWGCRRRDFWQLGGYFFGNFGDNDRIIVWR